MQYPTVQELMISTALAWGALGGCLGLLAGVAIGMAARPRPTLDPLMTEHDR